MKQTLFCSLLLLLFAACSPRIGTMVTKTYPPLSTDAPVVVYLYQTDIPLGTESLGKVTVADTGFSTNCDSATVINHIKNEARKIGGNAICITDHIRPSIWRSPCHQMTAIVLKLKNFDQSDRSGDNSVEEFTEVKNTIVKPALPPFKIGANIGYGWRTARLSDEPKAEKRDFYKKMMSGMIWDGSFHYYFNDTYGLGFFYSSYAVNNSIYAQMTEPAFEIGMLNSKNAITFIGPVVAMRAATNDNKWLLHLNMGIGYLRYCRNETLNSHYFRQDGSTTGFHWSMEGEYKFDKHWGIGLDFTMISGLLNKLNNNIDGVKYEQDSQTGLGQFRLTTGLRYYF